MCLPRQISSGVAIENEREESVETPHGEKRPQNSIRLKKHLYPAMTHDIMVRNTNISTTT